MKKTRYYSVAELKFLGTYGAEPVQSKKTLDSQIDGQLTLFKPLLITDEGQMTIASMFPKNSKSLKKLMKNDRKRNR